jgi:HlyD family secretion protein
MNKRTRNLLIILGGIVVVILIAVLAGHRGSSATPVQTQKAALTKFQIKLPETGTIQRPNVQTIPSLVAGNLGALYVKAGDRVSAGQLLATIENPTAESNAAGTAADYQSAVANISSAQVNEENAKVQYQAAVATAKSALDLAQKTYDADVNLYANKAIARQQLDTDQAKLQQAQVQYQQAAEQMRLGAVSGYGQNSVQYAQAAATKASILNQQQQQQLGFTRIVAPFGGVVQTVAAQTSNALRTIQVGDPIVAGQALFTMSQGSGFIVKAQVDEQDIAQVRVGQYAQVSGEDFGTHTFPGHVAAIDPTAQKSNDPTSTSMQVLTTIALDSQSTLLRDGMTADVDIYTTSVPHALTVPSGAVVVDGAKKYVFVVRAGKATKVAVTTGASNDTSTIVNTGIAAGDNVIAKPAGIVDGQSVRVLPSPSPSPGASAP